MQHTGYSCRKGPLGQDIICKMISTKALALATQRTCAKDQKGDRKGKGKDKGNGKGGKKGDKQQRPSSAPSRKGDDKRKNGKCHTVVSLDIES